MPVKTRPSNDSTRQFAVNAAQLMEGRHCDDVRLLDVRGLSQVCDYVLIATGTSDRQMKSVAHELEKLGAEQDNKVYRSSRDDGGTWIVVDFVDVVIHLFEPNQRTYYDIETLWADSETIDWKRDQKRTSKKLKSVKTPASLASASEVETPIKKKRATTKKASSRKKSKKH